MARVPTLTTPFTGPALVPEPFQQIRGGPKSGAVWDAAQGLAQQGLRTGLMGADLIARERLLESESLARDAVTEAKRQGIALWADYGTKLGRDAAQGFEDFQGRLQGIYDEALAGLPNDRAKQMAGRALDTWRLDMLQNGTNHWVRENKAWALSSSEAAAELATQSATTWRHDPAKVRAFVTEGEQEIVAQAEIEGLDEVALQARLAQYRGTSYRAIVGALAEEDPLAAQALFEGVRDGMDAASQAKLAEYLRPRVLNVQADAVVSAVTMGAPSPAAAEAYRLLIGKGWSPVAAAAIVGHGVAESDLDPTASGDGGESYGAWQWHKERKDELAAYAEARGLDPSKLSTQVDFLDYELRTSETTAAQGLVNARTVEEATEAFMHFERPAGYSAANPRGGMAWEKRLASAESIGVAGPIDPEKARADLLRMTAGNPELQQASLAKLNEQIGLQNAALAQRRAELKQQVEDIQPLLLAGEPVAIPEAELRAVLPQDEADRLVGELKNAQQAGLIYKGLRWASPEEIASARADLASGEGAYSAQIAANFAGQTPEAVTAARLGTLATFDKALAERERQLAADPAAYVAAEPTVAGARAALAAQPSPETWQAYATASLAMQGQLGVLESDRRILDGDMRARYVNAVQTADPKGAADALLVLQDSTGDLWPQVFGEISTGPGAISRDYQAVGIIADPVARGMLVNALQSEREAKGSLRKALGTGEGSMAQEVDDALDGNSDVTDFMATFAAVEQGMPMATSLKEAMRLLAYSYAPRVGASEAADRAVAAIVGQFDIVNDPGRAVARAPAGLGEQMQVVADITRLELQAELLMPLGSYSGVYTDEEMQAGALDNALRGEWTTSPDGRGWSLIGVDGDPVYLADGSVVSVTYDEAEGFVAPTPAEVMQKGARAVPGSLADRLRQTLGQPQPPSMQDMVDDIRRDLEEAAPDAE